MLLDLSLRHLPTTPYLSYCCYLNLVFVFVVVVGLVDGQMSFQQPILQH